MKHTMEMVQLFLALGGACGFHMSVASSLFFKSADDILLGHIYLSSLVSAEVMVYTIS
jgi:hypothetical protein